MSGVRRSPAQPDAEVVALSESDIAVDGGLSWRDRIDWRKTLTWLLATAGLVIVFSILVVLDQEYRSSSGVPQYSWDFTTVQYYLPALFVGFRLTVQITVLGILLGMSLGIVVAIGRLAKIGPIRWLTTGYIEVMRGTPALVQLVWVYYALPILTGIQLPAFESVVLAITLNTGAFYGEAFRSGIQAIPREQVESAEILGLSYVQRMRYVIIPQATRIVLPVLISLSISLFKDTSLVSVLGVGDLMYQGRLVSDQTYRPLEIFTSVALIYFAVAFPTTLILRRIEIHLSRHLRAVF